MKRQIGICFLLSAIVVLLSFCYLGQLRREEKKEQFTEEPWADEQIEETEGGQEFQTHVSATENKKEASGFYGVDEDGMLYIYEGETDALYLNTGIRTSALPKEWRERLKEIIYFPTEEALFEFLETYSS